MLFSDWISGALFGKDGDGPDLGNDFSDQFGLDGLDASVKPDHAGTNGNGGGNGNAYGKGGGGGPAADPDVLTTYTSSAPGSDYNVTIDFTGEWTATLQDDVIAAANYLSSIILGDLPDVGDIDDIEISANLTNIDGPGGILGSASPNSYRTSEDNYLPYRASMRFDTADVTYYESDGRWYDIVLHELFHTIGFGVLWSALGLVNSDKSMFLGTEANRAFQQEFPGLVSIYDYIPVETDGGSGTAGSHWDDATFTNELMTGYISTSNYVSDMTIASLEDLGYNTVWVSLSEMTAIV